MDTERTVNTLRDAVNRRQRDLPLPEGVDVDTLLEEAADVIEHLKRELDSSGCEFCG